MADSFVVRVETAGLDEAIAKARMLRDLLADCEFRAKRLNMVMSFERVNRLGRDVFAALADK